MEGSTPNQRVIGNTVTVTFTQLNQKGISSKVDTGATTSSLHATNITVNHDNSSVSFSCDALSPNTITMDLNGAQTVHSADSGGDQRPTIRMDVTVDGQHIPGVEFNLNDRSNMDSPILVGQNILKAGNFIIDVKKDEEVTDAPAGEPPTEPPPMPEAVDPKEKIMDAMRIIVEANLTIGDLLKYMQAQSQPDASE
jgi:hypothetical protein